MTTVQRSRFYVLPLIFVISCGPNNDEETATKGHLRLLVSESVAPIVIQDVNNFMAQYQSRGADVTYRMEQSETVNARFVHDTARAIVTTISLTAEEKNRVAATTDNLVEIVLGYDGIVVVVHNKNPLKKIGLKTIRQILRGEITTWQEVGKTRNSSGRIHLVLEDSSDVSLYLCRRLLEGKEIKANFRAASSARKTLSVISGDPLALGFVGLAWLDSAGTKVKVLDVSADSALADTTFKPPPQTVGNAYSPHPAHIYLNYYPMKRAIYIYARTSPGDFANGFASYLASPAGQRIFLEGGLVPGTQKIVLK